MIDTWAGEVKQPVLVDVVNALRDFDVWSVVVGTHALAIHGAQVKHLPDAPIELLVDQNEVSIQDLEQALLLLDLESAEGTEPLSDDTGPGVIDHWERLTHPAQQPRFVRRADAVAERGPCEVIVRFQLTALPHPSAFADGSVELIPTIDFEYLTGNATRTANNSTGGLIELETRSVGRVGQVTVPSLASLHRMAVCDLAVARAWKAEFDLPLFGAEFEIPVHRLPGHAEALDAMEQRAGEHLAFATALLQAREVAVLQTREPVNPTTGTGLSLPPLRQTS